MIKILLVIDYSIEFSRKLLKGLINYSKEHESIILFRLPSYYKDLYGKEGIVKWAKKWGADAILAQWDQDGTNLLENLGIPIVLQNFMQRSEQFSNLTGDYFGTGALAAEFFIQRRFKNFAFYGNKSAVWSRERAEGFKNSILNHGGYFFYFESENLIDDLWSQDHMFLERWLKDLPKPIALFACDDNFALQVAEICKISNIKIPEDIALLGVDNDELICNLSDPPISSIVLDVEKGGYDAGKLISQLVNDKTSKKFNIIIHPTRIELRQSTEKFNIENKYVNKIVNFIRGNFTKDISIDYLTEMVPLSRRNLEIKFKNEMGNSIYQFILQNRIEYFTNLLLTTERNLFDLALEAGFNDSKNVSRIFKKFKGLTPIEFREKYSDLN